MRISARVQTAARLFSSVLLSLGLGFIFLLSIAAPASAQTVTNTPVQQTVSSDTDYRNPNIEDNVPRNSHTYAQAVVIDVMSAVMCQLTGIDPVTRQATCLGINTANNKLGYAPTQQEEPQFGEAQVVKQQIGGALGAATNYVSVLFVPTVSSSQYSNYLASNFGIVKSANAAQPPATQLGADCQGSPLGYGFCGLQPIFGLWVSVRDMAYAILVIAFIFLGLGVMLRFKVDPRTVMTLQNQIPRVIIAILLITFSYAIAGIMIDIMWTVTYAGINIISSSTDAKVREGCASDGAGETLQQAANGKILDQPVSFANRIYQPDCQGFNSGISNISGHVGDSFSTLIISIIDSLTGWSTGGGCSLLNIDDCLKSFGVWITDWIVQLIVVVIILVALFRLWFELVKAYITFFIFVIMGPIWIVMGLIPGRPLGFERWLRLIFANLAAFPLVAFILVFARVLMDAVPASPDPRSVFIPPLVGNPSAAAFNALMALGAILIAPSIPGIIRQKMKAGDGSLGKTIGAGAAAGFAAATNPAAKMWQRGTKRDQNGNPIGAISVGWQNAKGKIPGVQRYRQYRAEGKQAAYNSMQGGGPTSRTGVFLDRYNRTSGTQRQNEYNRASTRRQAAIRNQDHDAAIEEDRNRP
jgi:hypothetical protein